MDKLCHFSTKMAITSPRKVQIPKFWCLKSSTNIWLSFGNINLITKVKNMELVQKEGSKLAKICQFFALKKLKLHFLKNFPRFDFTAFFCDFQCIRPIIIHWPSSWNRTGVVGGMHGWRVPSTHKYTLTTLEIKLRAQSNIALISTDKQTLTTEFNSLPHNRTIKEIIMWHL